MNLIVNFASERMATIIESEISSLMRKVVSHAGIPRTKTSPFQGAAQG